jgi:hypothetical protein
VNEDGSCCDDDTASPVASPMLESNTLDSRMGQILASSQNLISLNPVGLSQSPTKMNTRATAKTLLSTFTILYVVSGSIQIKVDDDNDEKIVHAGDTFIVERHDDSAPTDIFMTAIVKTKGLLSNIGLKRNLPYYKLLALH